MYKFGRMDFSLETNKSISEIDEQELLQRRRKRKVETKEEIIKITVKRSSYLVINNNEPGPLTKQKPIPYIPTNDYFK